MWRRRWGKRGKLQGHANDAIMGRAVRRAGIVLLDSAQNQVAHVSSDASGDFTFPAPLAGTFELRVDGVGINPVHTALHIEPSASGSSLEIDAAFVSGCSVVRVK